MATAKPSSESKPPSVNPLTSNSTPNSPPRAAAGTEAVDSLQKRDITSDIRAVLAWIAVASGVAALIGLNSTTHGIEFVTAYILEYSLSVDNLFVFLLIFNYFKVPPHSQSRVLNYGIIGAIVMRGFMIVTGEALTQKFEVVSVGFAALLIYSAVQLLLGDDDDDEDLENNSIVKFSRRLFAFSDHYDGEKFFTVENGVKLATPLMLVLLCIEFSDVVFALDSVPAVLGISKDTMVIYLSNIMAIVGLRNLYFVLSDTISDLRFLPQSLAIVLGFVGCKMIGGVLGYNIGVIQSLAVVAGALGTGVGLSLAFPEQNEKKVS